MYDDNISFVTFTHFYFLHAVTLCGAGPAAQAQTYMYAGPDEQVLVLVIVVVVIVIYFSTANQSRIFPPLLLLLCIES